MELKDILETLEKYTSKDILAELDTQRKTISNLGKTCQTASDAYFADVERKEQAVATQIEKFKANIAKIDAQIKAVQPALVAATAQGDTTVLQKIQGKLADYEAQKAAIGTQIQLLQSASIKGSNELVRIADEKDKLLSDANIAYEAAVRRGLMWKEIAGILGVNYSYESVRTLAYRYLRNRKKPAPKSERTAQKTAIDAQRRPESRRGA